MHAKDINMQEPKPQQRPHEEKKSITIRPDYTSQSKPIEDKGPDPNSEQT